LSIDPTTTPAGTADESESALELPRAPRTITPRARRRSWNEKQVRLWLILTALVAGATTYFAIRDISAARYERRLIFHGTKVIATVLSVDEYERPGRGFPLEQPRRVRMQYQTPAGEDVIVQFTTPGRERGRIEVDNEIELRVDPDDPDIVTMQTTPRSWISSLTVVILLAPIALLLAIVTLVIRKGVLNVWTNGEPAIGTVVDTHRSGIAPRSEIVRFTVNDIEDRRVFSTLYPHSHGQLQQGDELALVMPKNAPAKAIAAELYV
jgi:hypothetical protein